MTITSRSKILLFSFFLIFLFAGCDRPKSVLNQREMEDVLFDLHKLEGTLSVKDGNYIFDKKDNLYYSSILKKHHITQADFDSSVVWYTKHPKQFERMYDNIIDRMSALKTDVKKWKYNPQDSLTDIPTATYNVWNKPPKFKLTKDSARSKIDFQINNGMFLYSDNYILKFIQRIDKEDSASNRHIVLRIKYDDNSTDSVKAKSYADNITRRYTIRLKAIRLKKITSLSGELLAYDKAKGKQHSFTDSITLTRKFNPEMQDSIRKMLSKQYDNAPALFMPGNGKDLKNLRQMMMERKKTKANINNGFAPMQSFK